MIAIFPLSAFAEDNNNETGASVIMTDLFEAKTYTSSKGTTVNYRIFLPKDYNEQKKYPLILFLHGAGQRGDNNTAQLDLGICEPFKNPNSEIYQCIVIAPQCPEEGDQKWVNVPWGSGCKYDSEKIAETPLLSAVVELFQKTQEDYAVDPNRVYGTGISMGGYGIWDILVRHPRLFAAAMPICGGADYRKANLIKDIPIWTFHGEQDTVVPRVGTETMVNALKKLNGNITYTPYPDLGHVIWQLVYSRDDVLPWLLSQKFSDRFPDEYVDLDNQENTDGPDTPVTPDPGIKKSSCKSTLSCSLPVIATVSVAAMALKKRKKKK